MNRGELRQAVIDNTARTDKASVINTGINLGLTELGRRYDFREMRSESDLAVVATNAEVALPSNTHHVITVDVIQDDNSYPFYMKSKKSVRRYGVLDQTGRPFIGYVEDGSIKFYPISNDSYTLRVTVSKLPVAMTLDTAEPTITSVDSLLISYGSYYLLRSLGQRPEAEGYKNDFYQELPGAILSDQRNHTDYIADVNDPTSGDHSLLNPWEDPFAGFNSNYWR